MLAPLRPKLTYANVMVTLLAFIVLGGGAYAAVNLPKNSVGTKQIKKNAVTTAKIRKQAVTAAKVKNGTLTGKQINASTLGTVPSAANADTVGGVGLAGLLRSDRVLTGSVAPAGAAGKVVLSDPRTGLAVLSGVAGRLRLMNTNAQDTIIGEGIGYISEGPSTPRPTTLTLAPGAHEDVSYEAVGFTYGQYVFTRQGSLVPLQLTCLRVLDVLSCVAVG